MINNHRGFSLITILIGVAILAGGSYLYITKVHKSPDNSDTYTLTGVYESVEMKTEQKGDATCHTLAVSGGDESIINEFKDLINKGNTVQSLSVDGKVRVNLPWNTMSDAVKTKLQSGTSVTLLLIKEEQTRGDAINLCHSFFKSAELKS